MPQELKKPWLEFEKSFNLAASKNFFEWDFEKFKNSQSLLYKTLKEAYMNL